MPAGKYEVILNTDNPAYGGFGLTDDTVQHFTLRTTRCIRKEKKEWLKLSSSGSYSHGAEAREVDVKAKEVDVK